MKTFPSRWQDLNDKDFELFACWFITQDKFPECDNPIGELYKQWVQKMKTAYEPLPYIEDMK